MRSGTRRCVRGGCVLLAIAGWWGAGAMGGVDKVDTARVTLLKTFVEELVPITPGEGKFARSFVMGTERGMWTEQPARQVVMTDRFWIAKYEVPQNLWEAVMGNNPSRWKGPRNSVEMLTYAEAKSFCAKLTELLRAETLIADDEEIRLPSEAEWEYCCRAGTTTAYSFGETATGPADMGAKASVLDAYAWHTGNAAGNDPPVGALKPNPWGLYDLHGYLWEFVDDDWRETYPEAPVDGSPDRAGEPGARRVVRGGSWKDRYECLRSAHRRPVEPGLRDDAIGLRCVKGKVRAKKTG